MTESGPSQQSTSPSRKSPIEPSQIEPSQIEPSAYKQQEWINESEFGSQLSIDVGGTQTNNIATTKMAAQDQLKSK